MEIPRQHNITIHLLNGHVLTWQVDDVEHHAVQVALSDAETPRWLSIHGSAVLRSTGNYGDTEAKVVVPVRSVVYWASEPVELSDS